MDRLIEIGDKADRVNEDREKQRHEGRVIENRKRERERRVVLLSITMSTRPRPSSPPSPDQACKKEIIRESPICKYPPCTSVQKPPPFVCKKSGHETL